MTTPVLRRLGAVVASAAVVVSATTIAAPANAVTPKTPLNTGADWVAAQLTKGIVHDNQYNFDDVGGSINAAADLKLAGGHANDVAAIVGAVGSRLVGTQTNGVSGYIQGAEYASTAPYGFVQIGYYANAAANALVFAQTMGQNPATYGGTNLVTAVENRVATTTGADAGKIADDSSYGDYANSIGQALAARGLADAGAAAAPYAASALDFLLKQQCSVGYFRLYWSAGSDSSWTCDSGIAVGKSPADPDTTSLVMQQLEPLAKTDPVVAVALAKAKSWLASRQHSDGSFGGGTSTPAPNANSTGLAGAVLGDLGDTTAARKAAVWIRQHQVQEVAPCTSKLSNQTGAIAYDDSALAAGRASGITTTVAGQWRSATFQALPVLKWAPTTGGTFKAVAPTKYVKARTRTNVILRGLVPGSAACVFSGGARAAVAAGINGTATASLLMPAGTGTRVITAKAGNRVAKTTVKVLGAKRLNVKVSTLKPHHGRVIVVTVHGLAPRESVLVTYSGKTVHRAHASAKGTFSTRVHAGPVGKHKLVVTGQFANRSASRTLTVVR